MRSAAGSATSPRPNSAGAKANGRVTVIHVAMVAGLLMLSCYCMWVLHTYLQLLQYEARHDGGGGGGESINARQTAAARLRLMQILRGGGGGEGAGRQLPLHPPNFIHSDGDGDGSSGHAEEDALRKQRLVEEAARLMRQLPRNPMETNPLNPPPEDGQVPGQHKPPRTPLPPPKNGRKPVIDAPPPPPQPADGIAANPAAAVDVVVPTPPSPALSASAASTPTIPAIPILLFTFNRPENLRSTLESVLAHRPRDTSLHPVFISQDGSDGATRAVAMEYATNPQNDPRRTNVHYLNFRGDVHPEPQFAQFVTYYKIAQHYEWALKQVMDSPQGGEISPAPASASSSSSSASSAGSSSPSAGYGHVVLLEDDMYVSPDFFDYFRRMHQVLDADPENLLCASAWNDNGRPPLVGHTAPSKGRTPTESVDVSFDASRQLYRSDCFPGLGWMLSRRVWVELGSKWPRGFWDDWLREPGQRLARACVYPLVNRVYTFGEKGSSGGQFYQQFLKDIVLNKASVDWANEDLDYLATKNNYKRFLHKHIQAATKKTNNAQELHEALAAGAAAAAAAGAASSGPPALSEFVLLYSGLPQLDAFLGAHNMMTDHKAGIPRTSFEGVLTYTTPSNQRVWIVPTLSEFNQPL